MKNFTSSLFLLLAMTTSLYAGNEVPNNNLPRCSCKSDWHTQQGKCDEKKTEWGANKCLNRCDCSIGRECQFPPYHSDKGICVDEKDYIDHNSHK